MINNRKNQLDLSEQGIGDDGEIVSLDRRLFVQFLAFRGLDSTSETELIDELIDSRIEAALYLDANDYLGVGLVMMCEDPDFFVFEARKFLCSSVFSRLQIRPEYTMMGRTYSIGYERNLEETLIYGPTRKILDPEFTWAIWYPLRRAKAFETLSFEEQNSVLAEHGRLGSLFGDAGYAKDIRLASHGLDKNDNDFVIGILGRELYHLSSLVERMRKTKQTSMYLESLGPFFSGKKIFASPYWTL